MKRLIIAILGSLLLIKTGIGQNTLKGLIKNSNGDPLSNVRVYLMTKSCSYSLAIDNKTDKKTDANGVFQMTYLKSEEPVLYVEASGFERKKYKITSDTITVVLTTKATPVGDTQLADGSYEIQVIGVCGMCRKRIESAVFTITGIKKAAWNADSQKLTVAFDESRTNIDFIKKKIASVGHDAPPYKADDSVYKKLPACCKYRDKNKVQCDIK